MAAYNIHVFIFNYRYIIDKYQSFLAVNMNIKFDFGTGTKQFEYSILQNAHLPLPLCDWRIDFAVKSKYGTYNRVKFINVV